jgi:uncharacterized protein (TIGR02266 family)
MRTLQQDFHEYAHLDRKRTGDGITPAEYRRWLQLRARLDEAFSAGPPRGQAERRRSLRVPTRLRVAYDAEIGLEGIVTNLSRTGCFVRTDLPAAVGTRLTLLLSVAALGETLELDAEVVSTGMTRDGRKRERGMGMRFLEMSPEARKKLDALYEQAAATA